MFLGIFILLDVIFGLSVGFFFELSQVSLVAFPYVQGNNKNGEWDHQENDDD
jgi:hypothetical protein|tara:strand:- start:1149 stop:1304 length:156 start_codon:yes stop_codon:yes gene_type:complete